MHKRARVHAEGEILCVYGRDAACLAKAKAAICVYV